MEFSCANCAVTNCDAGDKSYPDFCLTTKLSDQQVEEVIAMYEDEENQKIMFAAAGIEYEFYSKWTRLEETIEFGKRIGAKRIGIATCVGLINETRILNKILTHHGFEVFGVACKVGAIDKTKVGLDPAYKKVGKNACNPIMQAKLLAEAGTDLNIVMGLCVGHDSLFYKYSKTTTTTLVAKDRVLGHNPAAAIYTSCSYYNKLLK